MPSYEPFYDGKYFTDGERCNGIVLLSDGNICFQAVGANGEIHERYDEEPILSNSVECLPEIKSVFDEKIEPIREIKPRFSEIGSIDEDIPLENPKSKNEWKQMSLF